MELGQMPQNASIGNSTVCLEMLKYKLIIAFSQLDAELDIFMVWPEYPEN